MLKRWLLIFIAALSLAGCGYSDFQRLDEASKSAWSEVLNQYQRRADLVPNLVATVKGEANFEQETLTRVVEARAKATSVQVTPETLNNPQAMQQALQKYEDVGRNPQYAALQARPEFQQTLVSLRKMNDMRTASNAPLQLGPPPR